MSEADNGSEHHDSKSHNQRSDTAEPEAVDISSTGHQGSQGAVEIVGKKTIWLGLAGILIGSLIGWLLGFSFGSGRLNIAGLAPLVSGGAGIPGFIFACFFGALLGLAGGLLGTVSEAHAATRGEHHKSKREAAHHGKASFIMRLPIYGSIVLALLMAYTLYKIASRGYGTGEPSDQSTRVTWNQKNVARIGGASDEETAAYVLQTAYPATRAENKPATIVNVSDDWRFALAATPLIARPINAALVISSAAGTDQTTVREIERMRTPIAQQPTAPQTSQTAPTGAQPPEPSSAPSQSLPTLLNIGTKGVERESIPSDDPAQVAAMIDERRAIATASPSDNVVIVSADADYRWALPAGAYAARMGTPILFVARDSVPPATTAALQRRNGQARIFVLGPTEAVTANVFDQLKQFGSVTRIEGGDYYESAVRFAEFRDDGASFGWGHTGRGPGQWSAVNSILVNGERWQDGVLASHLARGGKSGPLLFTQRERVPAVVDNYLWRQRPVFSNTPAEGPFNHVWVVGSFDRISYGVQAWADYSQEIEQYMTLGESAVSGFEALAIGWIILSIACAIWIAFHSVKRLADAMPMMKAAWAVFALLLGPIAVVLYIKSYNKREKMEHDGMVMWHRPMWAQVISATVMMFAFDMMLMVLAVFFLAYFGFPIIRFNGPLYWIGSSMFLMMVLMYVIALVLMMIVFHTPMTMHEKKINSYGKAFIAGLPIMLATMTVESFGMMPTMWWAQMLYLPAMQMPTGDDITMWATLLMSVTVGFLVVLPFNYLMVKTGRKKGTM